MCARLARLAVIATVSTCLCAAPRGSSWSLLRSEHFELYSQLDTPRSGQLLNWFEQMRSAFLGQSLVPAATIPPVRVVAFASEKEYEPYRVRAFSEGAYSESGERRYITMFGGVDERRVAAHELAHALLSSSGGGMPLWLSEGLAEFFSTVRVVGGYAEIGGDFPARRQILARRAWIPLPELMTQIGEAPGGLNREREEMFYAESWLLADMLASSPRYSPKFQTMVSAFRSGKSSGVAFRDVYGESIDEVEGETRAWVRAREAAKTIRVAGVVRGANRVESSEIAGDAARPLLADMLEAAGEFDRAGALLGQLAREQPRNAEILAALGSLALRKADAGAAREAWKQAMASGLADAEIAYRYALLADAAMLPREEIRAALERAIALRPDLDDARYKLALLEKGAGNYDATLRQLRAMRSVAPARAYAYWTVMADACNELGRRSEAIEAANKAAQHALTAGERARAENLAFVAQTDFAVQFARAADGRAEIITTRVPHQSAGDWNPFVEAGDDVRIARGILQDIECADGVTRLHLAASGAMLTLTIADPSRVQMRNAPEELTCGAQQAVSVEVQYAALPNASSDGLIRGIDFRNSPTLEK